jgi:5-dehydro-2-deoxygluconokinase
MTIELVCAGRLCVDLYAEQDGADLDRSDSFRRYLGGSAANICFGASRLGVQTAMLARIGDEQNGVFLRRSLHEAGVDTSMIVSDPTRLTPLVMLAIRPSDDFPRLFHYHESADMATAVEDIDEAIVAGAKAVLITGSFLANDTVRATSHRLVALAGANQTKVVLDIDYRPVLWGLVGSNQGQQMLVMSKPVTDRLREVLPFCDLVVGTQEEICIAGGSTNIIESLGAIRALTDAPIVMKVGARGCHILDGPIPADLGDAPTPGFPVDVVNTVGAGDGFFAGFLSGWLRDEPLKACARIGNAVGAIVVSRHGCSPAMPTAAELAEFLQRPEHPPRPGDDVRLRQLHRRGSDPKTTGDVRVLAIDHRWQMEALADETGADHTRIASLKVLLFDAFQLAVQQRDGLGILIDDLYGRPLLEQATGRGYWLARALDVPLSRPTEFTSGLDLGVTLRSWPADQIAKLMVYAHPDDADEVAAVQWRHVAQLAQAAVSADRRYLVEFQSPAGVEPGKDYLPRMLTLAYESGITPDWWKLPPIDDAHQWRAAADVIRQHDETCHGMLVLGQTAAPDQLAAALGAAASEPLVRGFAIGRAIFSSAASRWLANDIDDLAFIHEVVARYLSTIDTWDGLRHDHH